MRIDWGALLIVGVVAITTSVAFVVLVAGGIRLVSAARIKTNQGGSGSATQSAGFGLLGLAGLLVLFALYLIIPQFH
jgi:hypothetical protein